MNAPHRCRVLLLALLVLLALSALTVTAAAQQGGGPFEQARALRKSGKPGPAADLLGRAMGERGRDEKLAGLRGLCLLDAGRVPEARAVCAPFTVSASREPRLHTLVGRLAQLDGNIDAAGAAFRAALAAEPSFIEASVCLIRLSLSSGQYVVAVEEAQRLEALQPEMGRALGAEALVAQAQKFRRAGEEQVGRAIEKYEAALEKRPGDAAIVRALLDCLIVSIRIEEARTLASATFTSEQDVAERHYYEGRCSDALAEPERALQHYRAALAADGRYLPALLELARLAIDDGAYAEAREHLAQAASAGAASARSCLLLGLAEQGLGHDDSAEAALRESLRLDPGNTKALYHLGRLLARTGRGPEGESLLAQVNTGPQ